MATYIIGDVQGCFASLQALLKLVAFVPTADRLWFVGDLVNRGPDSLAVLRFVHDLRDRAVCVLGNHDLHLIARSLGLAPAKARDTLAGVLAAPDCEGLISWLRHQHVMYEAAGVTVVHAGLAPSWTLAAAAKEARRLEAALRDPVQALAVLGGGKFDPALRTFTTIRTCTMQGDLCAFDGPPAAAPPECLPWFTHPARRSRGSTVIFGHWAALGVVVGDDFVALDSGCVWGGALTALRLEDRRVYAVAAQESLA